MARSSNGLVCLCSSVVHLSTLYQVVMVVMVMMGCKYYRTYLAIVLLGKVGTMKPRVSGSNMQDLASAMARPS